ncbi:MAG: N-acetyltransferase [Variovorax sp.]|nr:MAG: N-acetyltransferase [Variovorax sp.]
MNAIGSPIAIGPFTPRHAEGAAGLILRIQQSEFGLPVSLDTQPDLRDIPGFYQSGYGNFWVALAGQEVVGTVALLDMGNRQAALRKMFVRTDHRGSGHGVARRLLETLFLWVREHGVRETYLGTTDKFIAAHRFYEKNGFHEIARDQLPSRFPVMAVDTRFYRQMH